MARKLARSMNEGSTRVVRLSNQKGYGVKYSRIEYSAAFKGTAQRLAERTGATRLVQVENVGGVDIRLVLGRDMARPAAPVQVVSATASGKKG